MIDPAIIEDTLDKRAANVRNSALDTAAKVAQLYGASDEVVKHILLLKNVERSS